MRRLDRDRAARAGHVEVRADVAAQVRQRRTRAATGGIAQGLRRRRQPSRARRGATARRARSDPHRRPVARSDPAVGRPGPGSRACTHSPWFGRSRRSSPRARPGQSTSHYTARHAPRPRAECSRRATIGAMTNRRVPRQTHVRPRPPSTGRPAPAKVKPRAPGPTRLVDASTDPASSWAADRHSPRPPRGGPGARSDGPVHRASAASGRGRQGDRLDHRRVRAGGHRDTHATAGRGRRERRSVPPTADRAIQQRAVRGPGRDRALGARRRHGTTGSRSTSPFRISHPRRSRRRRWPTHRSRSSRSRSPKGVNDFPVTIVGPGGESEPSPSSVTSSTRRPR